MRFVTRFVRAAAAAVLFLLAFSPVQAAENNPFENYKNPNGVFMTGQTLALDSFCPLFDDLLQKPFQLAQLRATVATSLDRKSVV